MQISNSMWVVDKAAKLALVDSIEGDVAIVRYFQGGDPRFGDLSRLPAAELTQASVGQLPPDHGMAPGELEALGYLPSTKPQEAPPSAAPADA